MKQRNYEAEYAREVMQHAVTQFELRIAKERIVFLCMILAQIRDFETGDIPDFKECIAYIKALARAGIKKMPSCQPLPDKVCECTGEGHDTNCPLAK